MVYQKVGFTEKGQQPNSKQCVHTPIKTWPYISHWKVDICVLR